MRKRNKALFLWFLINTMIFIGISIVQPPNTLNKSRINENFIEKTSDSQKNIEDTFNFIIERLKQIRNSVNFAISEEITPNSYTFTAADGDESVNVDETIETKNIVNPHTTNQSIATQASASTINTTHADIVIGFTYQLVKYKWEISWELELFGFKIAYAYFGIELDIGAGITFPIELDIDYFTEFLEDQSTLVNITLNTLDLPGNEMFFHFIARIYAGVNAFGKTGEWSIGPNYRVDQSYKTPLGEGSSVDLGTIEVPILELLGQLNIPHISQIAQIISDYVADVLIKLRFGIGSNLLSMNAAIYGNNTSFDGPLGPTSKVLNFTQAPETQSLAVYAEEPGPVRLELSDFKYHLNRLDITILLGLTWKTVFAYLFDDQEWQIYQFSVPLGNLFVIGASNTVTIEMNATSAVPPPPPPEIYDVSIVYISPMETIELGKDIAEYYVFVQNTGTNIKQDLYDIEVTGLDSTWIIKPPYLTIKEGSIGYFILKINPPREYSSTAGIHSFTVTIKSRGDPTKFDSITQDLNILPFYQAKVERISLEETGILDIEPGTISNVSFSITNIGNIAETFLLSMETEGLNSSIFEVPSSVILAPGESTIINANISIPKSSEYPALRYSVKLLAQSQSASTIAFDTVQMNILPFKNLTIHITENTIPEKIRAGSVLIYNVYVKNNGNFNDTIKLSLMGITSSSYEFGIEDQILFPGQELNTTLTLTIPSTTNALKSETFNLTFIAQFGSDESVKITTSLVIYTTPNYLPLILLIVAIGAIAASSPFIYRKAAPYIKRKLNARTLKKLLPPAESTSMGFIRIRLETCPFCYQDLTKGEIEALNSNLDTMCEKCGNLLKPEYLEVSIPKQKSIDEVVTEKMKKYKRQQEKSPKKPVKTPRIQPRKKPISRKQVLKPAPKKIEIQYCPHCFKDLTPLDAKLLKKGELTFCSYCRKIIKPEDYGN